MGDQSSSNFISKHIPGARYSISLLRFPKITNNVTAPVKITVNFDPEQLSYPTFDFYLPAGKYSDAAEMAKALNFQLAKQLSTSASLNFEFKSSTVGVDFSEDGHLCFVSPTYRIASIQVKTKRDAAIVGSYSGEPFATTEGVNFVFSNMIVFPFKPTPNYDSGFKIHIENVETKVEKPSATQPKTPTKESNSYYFFQESADHEVTINENKADATQFILYPDLPRRITVTNFDDEIVDLGDNEWEMILRQEEVK